MWYKIPTTLPIVAIAVPGFRHGRGWGNVRLIANTNGSGTAPRWSPDGKKLVFISMLSGKNTDKSW
jgi:hypothetical protein